MTDKRGIDDNLLRMEQIDRADPDLLRALLKTFVAAPWPSC